MINPKMGSRKGIAAFTSNPSIDQLSCGVSGIDVNPTQDDGWEEIGKESKNKTKASIQWGAQHSSPRAWAHAHTVQKHGLRTDGGLGRGSNQTGPALSPDPRKFGGVGYTKQQQSNRNPNSDYIAAPAVIPPLKNGWEWSTRASSSLPSDDGVVYKENSQAAVDSQASKGDEVEDCDDDSDDIDDSDDELLSDDFDSYESQKSHESMKKNKWFKELFQSLDDLTVEQINEPEREWHCPACQGGPGAIDCYHGLQPLISHAKTKRSKRMKLHRELAEVLDEELRRRGASTVPAGEVFGKWKGLDERADKEIVWPPMVMIMNTRLHKDDNEKWSGMGNPELLGYFSGYSAVKARHCYGPQGHQDMSLLIFEASAVGYAEAERLSKHFKDKNRDRLAWQRNKMTFYPGGQRQLFGYMGEELDLEDFNQHSLDKSKLKYEMRSYQEMVVKQMKQMSEDNQQLLWFKNKVVKEQKSKKALEEFYGLLTEKLWKTKVENQEFKLRTKKHHEQIKEEMDSQEQFYEEQIQQLYEARNVKEEKFEKIQQDEREKETQSEANGSSAECRAEEISRFIELQDKDLEEFTSRRDNLVQTHKERMSELKRKQRELWDEEMALEKDFDEQLNKLMEECTPTQTTFN